MGKLVLKSSKFEQHFRPSVHESLVLLAVVLFDYLFGRGTVQLHFWNWVAMALGSTLTCVLDAEKCVKRDFFWGIEGPTLQFAKE